MRRIIDLRLGPVKLMAEGGGAGPGRRKSVGRARQSGQDS